jgi:uridine kinase
MTRSHLIACLTDEILKRKKDARPLRVAIDGRCGSGKTTLADELASSAGLREVGCKILRPSVDGFRHTREHRYRQGEYSARGYYEDAFDYQAIIECLLGPLSEDKFPVACRQVAHDWRTNMPQDDPAVSVGANAILLFDGVFVLRRELNPYWDLRILVDVDPENLGRACPSARHRCHRGARNRREEIPPAL